MVATQPTTGGTWNAGGYADLDSRFPQRGGLVCVAIRQNQGALTNISPFTSTGAYNFSPLAVDNTLRQDLFAAQLVNGVWTPNPNTNLGFLNMGWFKESGGVSRKSKTDSDDLMGLQSNWPLDTDIVKQEKTIMLTPIETIKPLLQRVRRNQPLINPATGALLVEDAGQTGYFSGTQVDAVFTPYQMLLIRRRVSSAGTFYTVEPVPLSKLVDVGESKMDKKEADAADLSFRVLPDNYFLIPDPNGAGDYVPGIDGIWVGGSAWTAVGGAPIVSATPPVAVAGTTGKASFTFAVPTGGDVQNDQITAQFSTNGGTTWSAATLVVPAGVTIVSGVVTVQVTGLTAGATVFRGVVTGDNGVVTNTPASNSVTIS